MEETRKVSFKWKNYVRPTPANLKLLMEFWKGMIVLVTSNAIYNDAPTWVSISILILGYVVDRLAKFFAYVEVEEARTSVKVEFPTSMEGDVTVTKSEDTTTK